jgi:hypothetical protein
MTITTCGQFCIKQSVISNMPLPYLFAMAKDCLRANIVYMIFEVFCFVNALSLSCTVCAIIIHASSIMEWEKENMAESISGKIYDVTKGSG